MSAAPALATPVIPARTVADIEAWLVAHLADELKLSMDELDPTQPFASYGLDSVSAVTITGDLEQWLGIRVPATAAWDYPSILELARYLAAQVALTR
jgi:acyl carrier protein